MTMDWSSCDQRASQGRLLRCIRYFDIRDSPRYGHHIAPEARKSLRCDAFAHSVTPEALDIEFKRALVAFRRHVVL